MKLADAYQDMLRINLKINSKSTRMHYEIFLRHFGQFLGTTPMVEHLDEYSHSGFARWLMDRDLSPVTVNQRLHYMRALWRHCAKRGWINIWPITGDLPEPERMPVSWTEQEVERIWDAFDRVPGDFCGVRKGKWWRAFHEVVYWTGERKGAVLKAQWDWMRANRLNVPAKYRKGKRKSRSYWLPERAMEAIEEIREPARDAIFPLPGKGSTFYHHYHRLLRIAGVDGHRRGPQQMRRTHASMLARAGGDPTKSLGHSTSRVTELYYLDPSVCEGKPPAADLPDPGIRRDRTA